MKPHIRKLITGILLLSSCSIREERADCPCLLDLDLSGFAAYDDRATLSFWEGPNAGIDEGATERHYVRNVSKDIFDVSIWCSVSGGMFSGRRLTVPQGSQPDSLRLFRTRLDCRGETCSQTAGPSRQFARITLQVSMEPGTHYPYSFYVESDYCGIDLRDLSPIAGDLVFPVLQTGEDRFVFNLLRHGPDTKVQIGIYDGRERTDTFPLFKWLQEAGYDWEAPDLDEVTVYLDYVHRKIRIIISNWLDGGVLDIDI